MSRRCIGRRRIGNWGLAFVAALGWIWTPWLVAEEAQVPMNRVEQILRSDERLADLVADAERYRLQVVLGQIDETGDGAPRLVQTAFRAEAEYFYPASTIKLCAAVAALERLAELQASTGKPIDGLKFDTLATT